MLDNFLEIEVAYSMLKGGDEGEDLIDVYYKKFKTEMEVCKNYLKIIVIEECVKILLFV